jgi:hypothetical protein
MVINGKQKKNLNFLYSHETKAAWTNSKACSKLSPFKVLGQHLGNLRRFRKIEFSWLGKITCFPSYIACAFCTHPGPKAKQRQPWPQSYSSEKQVNYPRRNHAVPKLIRYINALIICIYLYIYLYNLYIFIYIYMYVSLSLCVFLAVQATFAVRTQPLPLNPAVWTRCIKKRRNLWTGGKLKIMLPATTVQKELSLRA